MAGCAIEMVILRRLPLSGCRVEEDDSVKPASLPKQPRSLPRLLAHPFTNCFLPQITMIEAQVNYAVQAIAKCQAQGWASIEVKQDVHDAYNKQLQVGIRRLTPSMTFIIMARESCLSADRIGVLT